MNSFLVCIFYKILFGWSNHGRCNGRVMWYVWETGESWWGKPERKRSLGRNGCKREDTTDMGLDETGWEVLGQNIVAQGRKSDRFLCEGCNENLGFIKDWGFLTSWGATSISRRTLINGFNLSFVSLVFVLSLSVITFFSHVNLTLNTHFLLHP